MYTFDSRVRYSETGEDKKLSLEGLLNYFQDCSTFQSESLGRGPETLEKIHCAWVLSFYQVCLRRFASLGEKITVGTKAWEFRGFIGQRNFLMTDQNGEALAFANTIWSFLDMKKGFPTRLPAGERDAYPIEERLDMDYAPRKIPLPSDMEEREAFRVAKHNLDSNHHVNHVQYICMAQDCLTEPFAFGEIRAEYKMQARLGDLIVPRVGREADRVTVALCDGEKKPYATVCFLR